MAITGNDLLSKYEERKKKKKEESQGSTEGVTGEQLLKKYETHKRYKSTDTSGVDEKYLNTFMSDANSFFSGVGDNSISYTDANSRLQDLGSRYDTIQAYLYQNKGKLDEKSYSSLSSAFDEFKKGYDGVADFYGKFENEDGYNAWKSWNEEQTKLKEYDLEAGIGEIEALKASLETSNQLTAQLAEVVKRSKAQGIEASQNAEAADIIERLSQVGSTVELEKMIAEKEAYLKKAKYAQVSGADDFDLYSKQGASIENPRLSSTGLDNMGSMGNKLVRVDETNVGNIVTFSRDNYDKLKMNKNADFSNIPGKTRYKYMEEDEVNIYNYLLAKEGAESANEYLASIDDELLYREANNIYKTQYEGKPLKEVFYGFAAGDDQFTQGLKGIADMALTEIGRATGNSELADKMQVMDEDSLQKQYVAGMVREDLANEDGFQIFGSSVGQTAYDLASTTGNMLPSILVGTLNPALGAVTMGYSAAGNGYNEMINLGYDQSQARSYGLLVGAAEGLLQYAIGGITKLGGKAAAPFVSKIDDVLAKVAIKCPGIVQSAISTITKVGGNAASEALEEGLQTYLEPWIKTLATGEEYEAASFDEIAYSSLLGALSAGVLEGGTTVVKDTVNYVNYTQAGKAVQGVDGGVERLQKLGSTFSADSVAYKLAGQVDENTSAYTLGKLLFEEGASISELNKADITKSLERKGVRTKDAEVISKWLAAHVEGTALTDEQIEVLKTDDLISKTFRDVVINQNSTVNQRTGEYAELMSLANDVVKAKADAKAAAKAEKKAQKTTTAQAEPIAVGDEQVSETNSLAETPNASESEISGQESVSVKEIASVKDGEVMIRLDGGEVVNAREANLSTETEGLLYEAVAQMSADPEIRMDAVTANDFVKGYDPKAGVSVGEYIHGFKDAFLYGAYGFAESELDRGVFTSRLSEIQRRTAHGHGKMVGQERAAQKQAKIDSTVAEKTAKNATSGGKKGKVYRDFVDHGLTDRQKQSIKALEVVADALGVDIHVFESLVDENGMHIGESGRYVRSTNTIYIDLYAGNTGASTMMFTAAHELTHFIREWSPAKFKIFADFLLEQYGEKGVSVEQLVQRQIEKAKRNGRDIDFDTAYGEVIADSCEAMLTDSNAMEKIALLKAQDKSLWNKIKNFIADLVAKINKAYKGLEPDSDEAKHVRKMKDAADKLYEMWTDALVDAGENYNAASEVVENDIVENDIANKDILFNQRAAESHKTKLAEKYTKDASVSLDVLMQRYNKILGIWDKLGGELNSKFLNEWNSKVGKDRAFTVFKAQAGYKYNVELSSMCKKGVPLFEAIDTIVKNEVMKELDTKVIGKEEKEILYDILKSHSFEIPCAICYVEQARQREGVIIDNFLNGKVEQNNKGETTTFKLGWNQVLHSIEKEMKASGVDYTFKAVDRSIATDKYVPQDLTMDSATQEAFYNALKKIANEEISRYNKAEGKKRKLVTTVTPSAIKEVFKGTLPSNLKIFKVLFTDPTSRFTIESDLLYSSMTTHNLSTGHNALYSLFNSQGGVSGYKTKQGTVVYWGDILGKKWTPSTVRDEGGIRNQSNSDFQMYTLLDQVQMYIDFTAKGYYLQAYTKVLSELKLFGLSRGKINASLIPAVHEYRNADGSVDVETTRLYAGLDQNGNLLFDDIEGIDHKEAFMLLEDAEYSKSIGGICIGYSDNHILKLLDDSRVQQIIGFHDKTDDPTKRYRGARYARNYNGLNEAVDNEGKTIHIGFNPYVRKAEKMFTFNAKTETYEGQIVHNGKTYVADDIPKLAAALYLEMCEKKGYTPAYTDFDWHENYYKLLADFSLYDSQGHYAPHRKVAYQMPDKVPYLDLNGNKKYMATEDYIKSELEKELKVRDSIGEALADTSEDGIIPQFKKRVNEIHKDSSDVLYSDRSFDSQVDAVLNGADTNSTHLKLMDTPSLLQEAGLPNLPILMTAQHLKKIIATTGHGLDVEVVKKLPEYISSPVMIADSLTRPEDSVVIITEATDSENRPVIAAILLNGTGRIDGNHIDANIMTSAYGRNNFQSFLDRIADSNSVIFWDKKKSQDLSLSLGLQLPNAITSLRSDAIIHQAKAFVNTPGEKILYSDRTPYAPTFYSHMGKVVDGIKSEKVGATGVVPYLKGKGVKAEEIKWSGIEAWLEGKKSVTKAALQEFVAGSQLVIEEEMSKGDHKAYDELAALWLELMGTPITDTFSEDFDRPLTADDMADVFDDFEREGFDVPTYWEQHNLINLARKAESNARWSRYKLDGGSNYRELVFRLPDSSYSNQAMRVHWGEDAEGILVHARIQDMTTKDGKKMLFIEELQSDWHNEGLESGYVEDSDFARIDKLKEKADDAFYDVEDYSMEMTGSAGEWDTIEKTPKGEKLLKAYREAKATYDQAMDESLKKIPDAPFRNNYHEFVLKRLVRMAAEEGYDSIGWTPSEIQSERWSDEFEKAYRIEYDQDMPSFMRKYGKKWEATVGKADIAKETVEEKERILKETELENVRRDIESAKRDLARHYDSYEKAVIQRSIDSMEKTVAALEQELSASFSVWSMDIPDAMKESVLYEGQAMYQDRNPDSVSNRSLLAGALDSVAQNDIERNKLAQYKQKIETIQSEESKLRGLREQIKELSFAKGPKDTAKIKSLQNDATRIANRINTFDRQLLNLEASTPLKAVLEREKAMAYKKAEKEGKDALARYKEKAADTQRELMTRYQESRKKGVEGRHKTEMRHKIKNVVSELNQYLLRGNKDRHVPIELQKAVAEALDAVNMDTVGAEERIAKLKLEMMIAKNPEKVQEISRKIDHIKQMGDRMDNKLKALKAAYDKFTDSDDPLIANSHDEVISSKIESVIESVGETPLRDMNLRQLEDVYDMYRMVLTTVRNANKAFKAQKSESIAVFGNRVMMEVDKLGGKKAMRLKGIDGAEKFAWNSYKPVFAFERIGSKTLSGIYESVRAGEDVWATDVTEAKEFYREQTKKYHYDSWDFGKRYDFRSSSGKNFSLSLDQIMSLYAYAKREQAAEHLRRGGIVFDETTEVTMKTKLGFKAKFNPMEATAYNLSDETLYAIIKKLTPEQTAFVDVMQDYLSTTMGEKGNEVSLELYGIKLFKEKHYFPLKSAPQFMAIAKEQQQGTVKIKNSGFSKETVQKASNPIVLTPFMDVWSNHVNEMSMYHAFVLPMEDFYRVYNYKTPTDETMATESVEMFIQNAYGKGATQYIDQLLKDLNGGARTDPRAGVMTTLIGKFKKSAVFASASVVVQQPSAIARALSLVDAKYFVGKMTLRKHSQSWAEVKKYAPVAIIKEMGYFDTNMGMQTTEWMTTKEYSGFSEKLKALFTDSNFRDEMLSKAPALADEMSWCYIWEAVKRETRATTKLQPGTEEFLTKAGERFTEVVVKTQVYDSVLARSGMMRSKDTGLKMATAFMAEPTTSLNMIADAIVQGKRGNKAYAAKTLGAVAASMILNSILVSFVYAGRDDDEDKTYAEKYIGTLTEELLDSFNPLTLIPFAKDVVSIFQGYDVERSDMAVITDLVKAWNNLSSDNRSVYRKVEDFAGAIASIFGLPVKNIMRDARAMYNTVNSFINGEQTTGAGIKNAMTEAVTGKEMSKSDKLYDAMESGDSAMLDRIESQYKDQDAFEIAVRQALRGEYEEGDLSDSQAVDMLVDYGGKAEDEAIAMVMYWAFKQDNPDIYVDDSWISEYYADGVAEAGISIETFVEYRNQVKDITGEGKKERRMAVIHSLPITNTQKDALYLAEGWTESRLYEAPWH